MKITIMDKTTLNVLQSALKRIPDRAMAYVGQSIKSNILLNWKQGKDPGGKAWAPLAPSTIRAKRRKSGKVVMLVDTGNLKNSLNYRAETNKVRIGYSVKYSIFHQLGTRFMPQRKILPTDESEIDLEEIKEILLDAILSNK